MNLILCQEKIIWQLEYVERLVVNQQTRFVSMPQRRAELFNFVRDVADANCATMPGIMM
jgi:hypothetical protein